MNWLTDGHIAALAYQADIQARLDRDDDMSAEEVFNGCLHHRACARAQRVLLDTNKTHLPWSELQCEDCEEWECSE